MHQEMDFFLVHAVAEPNQNQQSFSLSCPWYKVFFGISCTKNMLYSVDQMLHFFSGTCCSNKKIPTPLSCPFLQPSFFLVLATKSCFFPPFSLWHMLQQPNPTRKQQGSSPPSSSASPPPCPQQRSTARGRPSARPPPASSPRRRSRSSGRPSSQCRNKEWMMNPTRHLGHLSRTWKGRDVNARRSNDVSRCEFSKQGICCARNFSKNVPSGLETCFFFPWFLKVQKNWVSSPDETFLKELWNLTFFYF